MIGSIPYFNVVKGSEKLSARYRGFHIIIVIFPLKLIHNGCVNGQWTMIHTMMFPLYFMFWCELFSNMRIVTSLGRRPSPFTPLVLSDVVLGSNIVHFFSFHGVQPVKRRSSLRRRCGNRGTHNFHHREKLVVQCCVLVACR